MGFLAKLGKIGKAPEGEETTLLGYANELDVKALFSLLGMIASATGAVSKKQIKETERFMSTELPTSLRDLAIASFREGKETPNNKAVVTGFAFRLYWNKDGRWLEPIQILNIMIMVALADDDYSSLEGAIIEYARATLGVHKRSYWILRDTLAERAGIEIPIDRESFAGVEDPRRTSASSQRSQRQSSAPVTKTEMNKKSALRSLELDEAASEKEIKARYRILVKRFHPDVLQADDATDSELEKAIQRFCEIQDAYEYLIEAL